ELLGHLLSNAVKFTHAGSVELRGSTARTADGEKLRLAVRDTGTGIQPEKLDAIFNSFQQGESGLARGSPGLALGRARAKQLAALMGGTVNVASEVGAGSTFTLDLPLRRPEFLPETRAEGHTASDLGPRILAVDDNPVGLRVLRHLLERRGVRVDCATSGAEALRAARVHCYQLVLMDLQMPEMDGLTT